MNSRQVKGLPAISADGTRLGVVERAFLDPGRRQIVGFAIATGGGFLTPESGLLADAVEIQAIGSGALTLASAAPAGAETGQRYGALVDLDVLHGRDVFSERGVRVGRVDSTLFDERTFTLDGIVVRPVVGSSQIEIPVASVLTIGPGVIVVAKEVGAPAIAAPEVEPAATSVLPN